jgi:hypothetical protein
MIVSLTSAGSRGGMQPRVELPVRVVFATATGRVYDGRVVALLPPVRGRRIVLVRLAVEDGPRADDFRALWFPARPTEREWTALREYPKMLQQACFPQEVPTPPGAVELRRP